MLTEEQSQQWMKELQDETTRLSVLQVTPRHPTGDIRILPLLESLLTVRKIMVLGIPFFFGEVRELAAYALAAEREAIGINEPVIL